MPCAPCFDPDAVVASVGVVSVSARLTNVVTPSRQWVVDYGKHPLVRVADLNEATGAADTAWVAEQQAAVAEVRLGHKEGGSCDPFTQEDAGRTPAAQLFRGHDSSLFASSPTVRRTLRKISRQVRARRSKKLPGVFAR